MLLSKSMGPPRAVSYNTLSWDQVNEQFRRIFYSGGEYDTSRLGAEQLSPVAAAHRILTCHFGVIPFNVYQKNGDAREPVAEDALDKVFKIRPNENMSPFVCGKTIMSNAFWHGVGYCWNRPGLDGKIAERIPLPTECCHIRRDQETGTYWYDFTVDGVFHSFSGHELSMLFFESYDGIRGRGFLHLARETIGAEGAAQQYGRKFYQNGANPSAIVEVDADLNDAGRDKVRDQFSSYNPFGEDAFKVAVLTRGYKYTPMGLNQRDSQYIESRGFGVEEISRFTGIPKWMLQSGNESFDSNSAQRIAYVTDTLMPYIVQWEQENTYKALSISQRKKNWYFKGNPSVLLRGNDDARASFFQKMVYTGIYNLDECRALDERNPIPGGLGQKFLATKNLGSLESILKGDGGNA
ncbi:phage portal protein [Oscillibacter sp.]|uniref:phage portal protein n=1 Tax=Oscillibacter sp. TaxID=1945593 RepID=UPI00289EFF3F|nr:phage portal protein [Oscillibacter sp.]